MSNDNVQSPAASGHAGMSARQRAARRKAIYLVAIIALIVALFAMGYPATVDTPQKKGRPGGVLAVYRDKHGLSQIELGEVDPMSETVRLGTLGMRGLGSSLLWWAANEQQKKKDWTSLRATLDQISKLQPHSIEVWRYQAWNLSYNVSVAFDDYHDKFYWVIEGLNFMLDGIHLNEKVPRLYWDMGWFISNKIGRADEAKYYRRLFAGKRDVSESDADFRRQAASGDDAGRDFAPDYVKDFRERYVPPTGFPRSTCGDVPDNWHVGKAWFLAAESKINPPRYPVKGMADVIFYSDAPTCQFYYADVLEKDGYFDQKAVNAWKQATREWHAFGDKSIDTSWEADGRPIQVQLNREEELLKEVADDTKALDALVPGAREKLKKERYASLAPEQREAWDAAADKRTPNQEKLVSEIGDRLDVKDDEVARRAAPANAKRAKGLADDIEKKRTLAHYANLERQKVNFVFWRTRAEAEQTDDCVAARRAINDGDEAFAKGDQIRAVPYYEQGMKLWRKVLDRYPLLVDDPSLGGDLDDVIGRYKKCLDQDDRDLPQPFILQDIIKKHERGGGA
jgi:hypothetical protein